MITEDLLKLVVLALDDGKARDIKIIDVRGKTGITDFMVIASGTSERHVKALAGHVVEDAKQHELQPLGVEGENAGEWVLVDLGDVIVHVMKPQVREFYQIEKFWQGDYSPVYATAQVSR
jgi:ribosome-associated protein